MGQKASPALIGGFIVGAIILVVAGVLVFGSGQFLATKYPWVMYFQGSVKGLKIGAPVSFRGVQIGEVKDIRVVMNLKDLTVRTPVYIEFQGDRFTRLEGEMPGMERGLIEKLIDFLGGTETRGRDLELAQAMIDRGLRAQLGLQSLVTGQLFVQLDFLPDAPIRLVGVDDKHPEFPTVQSGMEQFKQKLEDLQFDELITAGIELAQNLNQLVTSPEVKAGVRGMSRTAQNLDRFTDELSANFKVLRREVDGTLAAARAAFKQAEITLAMEQGAPGRVAANLEKALKQAEVTLAMEEGAPGRLASSLTATSDEARVTLKESRKAVSTVNAAIADGSPLRYDLARALQELSAAARSIRVFAEYLERHPEALLVGKGKRGGRG